MSLRGEDMIGDGVEYAPNWPIWWLHLGTRTIARRQRSGIQCDDIKCDSRFNMHGVFSNKRRRSGHADNRRKRQTLITPS